MDYLSAILEHVVPIISEASKSELGLISLVALIVLTIVLLFLYLTARTRPVLSFVLALVAMLLMFGGVVGVVLSTPDISKPALVYDVKAAAAEGNQLQGSEFGGQEYSRI